MAAVQRPRKEILVSTNGNRDRQQPRIKNVSFYCGALAKTPWPGNLKMTKLNKIRSPHVATTTYLLFNLPLHTPLSTPAVHQGQPTTLHSSSDSRPSSHPLRPSTPTARATASAHTGVGRHPCHPPAVPCPCPNDGDGSGGPTAAAAATAATAATVSTKPPVTAAAASTGAPPTEATAGSTSASTLAAVAIGAGTPATDPSGSVPAGTMATAGGGGGADAAAAGAAADVANAPTADPTAAAAGGRRPARGGSTPAPPPEGRLGLLLPPTGARCSHLLRAHTRRPQAAPDGAAVAQQRPPQAPLRHPAAATATPRGPKRRGPPGNGGQDGAPALRAGGPPLQPTRRRPPSQPHAGEAVVAATVDAAA